MVANETCGLQMVVGIFKHDVGIGAAKTKGIDGCSPQPVTGPRNVLLGKLMTD
jgi:hypothetical protein